MRVFILGWTILLTIQRVAPSQKCFYTWLLRHYFEVHQSVSATSCPWTHKSIMTVLSRVASLSFPLECARHGGTYRSHRCETSLLGHSTHAAEAGYWSDSMCSCRWGHGMVIMDSLLPGPLIIFTQMEHDYFRKIQYNKKCAWKCLRVFLRCF